MSDADRPTVVAAWFERRFRFDLGRDRFPGLVERLRGTPCRLAERVDALTFEVLVGRPDDRWSILENAGHLLELESLWAGRVEDLVAARAELRAADLENRATSGGGYNTRPVSETLGAFAQARRRLIDRLEVVSAEVHERSAHHPRLGQRMRLVDHCYFVAEHDDHHLARITEIRRRLGC